MAGPDDELIAVTLRGEFRPDERVDLVYLDAPGALAERQAALPVVGVNDGYTEWLDVGSRERIRRPTVVPWTMALSYPRLRGDHCSERSSLRQGRF
jgi:hypothetical protein